MLSFNFGNLIFQLIVFLVPVALCCFVVLVFLYLRKNFKKTNELQAQNHAILKKLEERNHLNSNIDHE
jgi:hypothetical protein